MKQINQNILIYDIHNCLTILLINIDKIQIKKSIQLSQLFKNHIQKNQFIKLHLSLIQFNYFTFSFN